MAARALSAAPARRGDAPKAHGLAEDLRRTYPTNTFLNVYWLLAINAALAVGKGDSSQALLDLEPAAPYELGNQSIVNLSVPRVRARASVSPGTQWDDCCR